MFDCESLVLLRLRHLDLFAQEWFEIDEILEKNAAIINEIHNNYSPVLTNKWNNKQQQYSSFISRTGACHFGSMNEMYSKTNHDDDEQCLNKNMAQISRSIMRSESAKELHIACHSLLQPFGYDSSEQEEICLSERMRIQSTANVDSTMNTNSSQNRFRTMGGKLSCRRCLFDDSSEVKFSNSHTVGRNSLTSNTVPYCRKCSDERRQEWQWHENGNDKQKYSCDEHCQNCKQQQQHRQHQHYRHRRLLKHRMKEKSFSPSEEQKAHLSGDGFNSVNSESQLQHDHITSLTPSIEQRALYYRCKCISSNQVNIQTFNSNTFSITNTICDLNCDFIEKNSKNHVKGDDFCNEKHPQTDELYCERLLTVSTTSLQTEKQNFDTFMIRALLDSHSLTTLPSNPHQILEHFYKFFTSSELFTFDCQSTEQQLVFLIRTIVQHFTSANANHKFFQKKSLQTLLCYVLDLPRSTQQLICSLWNIHNPPESFFEAIILLTIVLLCCLSRKFSVSLSSSCALLSETSSTSGHHTLCPTLSYSCPSSLYSLSNNNSSSASFDTFYSKYLFSSSIRSIIDCVLCSIYSQIFSSTLHKSLSAKSTIISFLSLFFVKNYLKLSSTKRQKSKNSHWIEHSHTSSVNGKYFYKQKQQNIEKSYLNNKIINTDARSFHIEGKALNERKPDQNEWNVARHSLIVNRLRSLTQQLRHHSQHSSSPLIFYFPSSTNMKTFDQFKSSKQSSVPRDETNGKPPECKSSSRRVPVPPPPPPRPQSVAFEVGGSGSTTRTKSSPLSIFRRKPKAHTPECVNNSSETNIVDETLSPIQKDFKASSSSPPSAEYLQQHRPSCPSVTNTQPLKDTSTVTMRDNSTKELSKPLSRASYHPNSTTNLLDNPNPNSSRERGYGALPTRTSSSFTSTREKDSAIYPKFVPKRRLRGIYGELLESKMRKSNADYSDSESSTSEPPGLISKLTNGNDWSMWTSDSVPKLSFTEEILRQTRSRRKELDQTEKNTPERTNSQTELKSANQEVLEKPRRPNSLTIDCVEVSSECQVHVLKPEVKDDEDVKENEVSSNCLYTTTQVHTGFVASDGVSIMAVIGQHLDTRTHIVGEMYDLEKSYCEFLRSLMEDLSTFEHTKENEQNRMIDVILSRLPSVLEVHCKFLEQLRRRMAQWANDSQIGDLFELFRTPVINDFYELMVDRLQEFLPLLKQIWKTRTNGKNHAKCKIAAEDMLIRIIQRMPQYKTLLDRLLKNTPETHNDYLSLKSAFGLICQVLERMNTEQNSAQSLDGSTSGSVSEITTPLAGHSTTFSDKIVRRKVRDIENIIDGLSGLNLRSDDVVHFFDYVTIGKRKRAVILLDTCVLICESKRRYKSSTNSSLRDARFKLEQNIEIEKVDLRCQCWQSYFQHSTTASMNNCNLSNLSNTEHHLNSSSSNFRITNQLQAAVSTESLATSIGCCSCIETLEADVKTLTKLKSSANEMRSLPIRKLLKDNLNEIQDTVYRQLMSMHTTILNCSLDTNVDLYLVPPCLNHTLTDQNLVELLRFFEQQPHSHKLSDESVGFFDITAEEAFEYQTKFRLTHLRCPQHQPNVVPFNTNPLISLSFSCNKKRAYFETVLLCLRAKLFKSRLVLNSVFAMPYEKTRLTLQFRCAGAALGTNNIWICTSDRGQAQISVLVLSSNNEIEHTIVSCNTVATSQILTIFSVPGTEHSEKIHFDTINSNDGISTKTNKTPQESEIMKVILRDEKMRSNSIQVPAFFQNLKPTKSQQQQHRNSKHFESISNVNIVESNRNCSGKHPTMWFATADQQLNIYSCFDNIRTGKHKTKIALDAQIEAIQYYSDRVFVALSNSTVAIFQREATGYWQSEPTLIENTLCNKLCVVQNTSGKEQLWAASLSVVTIRDDRFTIVEETIHMHESEKIASMVSDGRTIVLTLVDSCDIYRYSTVSPYQRLCTISIGPFVDKALSTCDQIIRFHKLACLKISDLHAVQNRIWIGTSAGVLLVMDVSNTIHIVPDGFTGRVSFIVSTRLDNGQTAVLSGGDGRERFRSAPGNTISTMAGPAELYNFMSFCSSVPNHLVEQNSNVQNSTSVLNNLASISLPNSPLNSSHTAQIVIRRAAPSQNSQLTPSTSSVSRTSEGSMTSGVSSAGTILSCDSIETKELNDQINCPLRSGTATTGTPNSFSNTPTSASQTVDGDFHSTWGSEDSQSYLLVWKL